MSEDVKDETIEIRVGCGICEKILLLRRTRSMIYNNWMTFFVTILTELEEMGWSHDSPMGTFICGECGNGFIREDK